VRLTSAPIDDVHNELRFVLDQDGGPLARTLLRLASFFYRIHHSLMLVVLRRHWGSRIPRGSR